MSADTPPSAGTSEGRPLPGVDTPGTESPFHAHLAAQAAADGEHERGPALVDWKARWDALGSTARLRLKQAALAGAVVVLGGSLYLASRSEAPTETAPAASKLDMGAGLRGDSLEEKLRGDLKKIVDGQQLLGERVSAIEEGKVVPHGAAVAGGESGDGGELPPALPVPAPAYPPSPTDTDGTLPVPPVPPAPPAAPPAPPIQKVVGSIGAATSPVVPKDADAKGQDSKKRTGRSICRLVS